MNFAPQRDANPWLIAGAVMLATFMEVLDTTVVNVSLPHIAGNLSASIDESTWTLTAYLVANAIVLPLSGWFSTLFGRKRFYITCVILFTVSSALCGLAPSLGMLVFFRILQGLGGGALQPVSQAILVESFPKSKQGMAMAIFGIGVIFAPVIGPTLGGWITDNASWRWIFLINIPIGILSVLLAAIFVFDPPYLRRKSFADGLKLDYIGLGLLGMGLAFLEIMLDNGQRDDWFSSHLIIASAVIATVCLIAVVFWELRVKDPVVDLRALKDRNFALATGLIYVIGFMLYGSTMLLPVFLQTSLGYTATLSGLVLSPGGIIVAFLMPLIGVLVGKVQPRWLIVFGLVISAAGLLRMTGFDLEVDYRTALLARVVQMIGIAFLFVPINTAAFAFMPREKVNNCTGLINLARNIGGSAGIATATTILARRQQFHQQMLVSHVSPLDTTYQALAQGTAQAFVNHGSSPADAAQQAQAMVYGMVQQHAAMLAFIDDFWVFGLICLAIIPLALAMKSVRRRT
jgi:DHA2 family multidrug resistance protein